MIQKLGANSSMKNQAFALKREMNRKVQNGNPGVAAKQYQGMLDKALPWIRKVSGAADANLPGIRAQASELLKTVMAAPNAPAPLKKKAQAMLAGLGKAVAARTSRKASAAAGAAAGGSTFQPGGLFNAENKAAQNRLVAARTAAQGITQGAFKKAVRANDRLARVAKKKEAAAAGLATQMQRKLVANASAKIGALARVPPAKQQALIANIETLLRKANSSMDASVKQQAAVLRGKLMQVQKRAPAGMAGSSGLPPRAGIAAKVSGGVAAGVGFKAAAAAATFSAAAVAKNKQKKAQNAERQKQQLQQQMQQRQQEQKKRFEQEQLRKQQLKQQQQLQQMKQPQQLQQMKQSPFSGASSGASSGAFSGASLSPAGSMQSAFNIQGSGSGWQQQKLQQARMTPLPNNKPVGTRFQQQGYGGQRGGGQWKGAQVGLGVRAGGLKKVQYGRRR